MHLPTCITYLLTKAAVERLATAEAKLAAAEAKMKASGYQ